MVKEPSLSRLMPPTTRRSRRRFAAGGGSIINTSSGSSLFGDDVRIAYGASKGAVNKNNEHKSRGREMMQSSRYPMMLAASTLAFAVAAPAFAESGEADQPQASSSGLT